MEENKKMICSRCNAALEFHKAHFSYLDHSFSTEVQRCPVCGVRLPAKITVRRGATYLEKSCPEHGDFSAVIWKNKRNIFSWYGDIEPLS